MYDLFYFHCRHETLVDPWKVCIYVCMFVCVCVYVCIYNNNIYLLQLGCYPVAVVILHVNKT